MCAQSYQLLSWWHVYFSCQLYFSHKKREAFYSCLISFWKSRHHPYCLSCKKSHFHLKQNKYKKTQNKMFFIKQKASKVFPFISISTHSPLLVCTLLWLYSINIFIPSFLLLVLICPSSTAAVATAVTQAMWMCVHKKKWNWNFLFYSLLSH